MARHVKFLALAHESKVLASHTHWDKEAPERYEDTLLQIFGSTGWIAVREQRKNKLELKSGANVYCMEVDLQGRVYVAVVTAAYPVKHIFSAGSAASPTPKLMSDFQRHVTSKLAVESISSGAGGLRRVLRPFLADLATRYDDLDNLEKVVVVQRKLEGLQATLGRTIAMADERHALLEEEEARTREMTSGARAMYQRTNALRRRACCAMTSWVWIAIIVLVMAAIALGIVVALNFGVFHWWK